MFVRVRMSKNFEVSSTVVEPSQSQVLPAFSMDGARGSGMK